MSLINVPYFIFIMWSKNTRHPEKSKHGSQFLLTLMKDLVFIFRSLSFAAVESWSSSLTVCNSFVSDQGDMEKLSKPRHRPPSGRWIQIDIVFGSSACRPTWKNLYYHRLCKDCSVRTSTSRILSFFFYCCWSWRLDHMSLRKKSCVR